MKASANVEPFGGYHRQLSTDTDPTLTSVLPRTPAGEYLRRFWHPIALSSELRDKPTLVRLLGEDLVLFRTKKGRVALLHRRCAHRGMSLEYGIIGDDGIRCAYHGWMYNVDGTLAEAPSEAAQDRLRETVCVGAYETHEYGGVIFAYMGPQAERPDFPEYDALKWPQNNRLVPYKLHVPCNWLQVHENAADPIHTAYLHAIVSGVQFSPSFAALPILDFFETPIGLLSVATRRCEENLWVRASDVILPNVAQFGTGFVDGTKEKIALCAWVTRWITPIDDTSCWTIGYRHFNEVIDPNCQGREDKIGLGRVDFMGQTDERPYEDRQRSPGDWDALVGQGDIVVRANEHLGSTDRGISMLRRQLRSGIRALQSGQRLDSPRRYGPRPTPTYNNETIVRVPRRGNNDVETIRAFGIKIAKTAIETGDLELEERRRVFAERVKEMAARNAFYVTSSDERTVTADVGN